MKAIPKIRTNDEIHNLCTALETARPDYKEAYNALRIALGLDVLPEPDPDIWQWEDEQ